MHQVSQSPHTSQNLSTSIHPGQTIGIVGGGQLGRMIAFSAKAMGYRVGVLDPSPNCPCAQVCDWHIQADYTNFEALNELAKHSDVLTYEFENVDADTLDQVADASYLPQGTNLLRITQDRVSEKNYLTHLGVPIAPYQIVSSETELAKACETIGWPVVLKTSRGGYDGKGQAVLRPGPKDRAVLQPNTEDSASFTNNLTEISSEFAAALEAAKTLANQSKCVLEAWIPFDLEISVLVAGNKNGDYVTLPVAENLHKNNILHVTNAPARISPQLAEQASQLAMQIARGIDLAGVLAVEMFVAADKIYVNELAPRPHNSGHYSIEACDFSQFDLHVLGICGRPLPRPRLLADAVMLNVLGQNLKEAASLARTHADWHFHYYGKADAKVDRKMGHITMLGEDPNEIAKLF